MKTSIKFMTLAMMALLFVIFCGAAAKAQTALPPDTPEKFTLKAKQDVEFELDLKADDLCNITTDAAMDLPITFEFLDPANKPIVKEGDPSSGYVFTASTAGRYRLVFKWPKDMTETDAAQSNGKEITVRYSNRLEIPKTAEAKGVRNINGYSVRIMDDPGDEGKTYLIIEKGGKTRAAMRADKEIGQGYYFSDDPQQDEDGAAKENKSTMLFRTTADKTGDGTPDVAVEYFTGGAHCCYEITFFELGSTVRQRPTIETANDRLSAVAKRPEGGLRFVYADQVYAYWVINFAQSPMPAVTYEFKNEELSPRFDLMRKPAPSLAVLRRKATAGRAKINLHPYKNPDDNFNDFEEPFWDYMLDLIYTGHEDLAWQYFDLVWPAKKAGKEGFRADFKKQLDSSAYGDWKRMTK